MSFGKRLSSLRDSKKISQAELAKLTSISRSRISLYEIDAREPDLETVKELASFFNTTTDYLLGKTDDPKPSSALYEAMKDYMLFDEFQKSNFTTDDIYLMKELKTLTEKERDEILQYIQVKRILDSRDKEGPAAAMGK